MDETNYLKYVCIKCKYKFTRKDDSPVTLRCPYCGGTDLVEDAFSINKAIAEVE